MRQHISILSIGMFTSVGLYSSQIAASVNSGISRLQEVEDWPDLNDNPYRGGFIPDDYLECIHSEINIDSDSLTARLIKIGAPALQQLGNTLDSLSTIPPLILGLSEAVKKDLQKTFFLNSLAKQSQMRIDIENSEVLVAGRSAGLQAIHKACMYLIEGYPGPIIAGGVDSYFDFYRLDELDKAGRILTESNQDGFLPGEGAGFVLLSKEFPSESQNLTKKPLGSILASAIGFEKGHLYSQEPYRGDGLAETFAQLFDEVPKERLPCRTIYANLNGETLDAKQWGVSLIRNKQYFSEDVDVLHPADCMGETGAAMGPIMVGLAIEKMCRDCVTWPFLIGCASDEGLRVAVYLDNAGVNSHKENNSIENIEKNYPPINAFSHYLYLEHFEEASFLYEQRISLLDNPEITWLDIESFENRFEAHIDGLIIGEELSIEICKKQIIEGDLGELHAAIRVFCHQNRLDFIKEVLNSLDFNNNENVQAFGDALKHEMPPHWQNEFIQMLTEGEQKIIPIMAEILGYKRLPAGNALLQTLQKNNPDTIPVICWAIGRIREKNAISVLLNHIHDKNDTICANAALALLRIGEAQTINDCMRYTQTHNWPHLLLGLGGGASSIKVLLQIASSGNATPDSIMALGLLGDITIIDTLLPNLNNPELTETTAMALNLITGAEIYEDVFIPEEIDEDELFEEEIEKLKRGESLYPPGEEPGTAITRVSQNPQDWQKWWTENKSRFNPTIRYRNGKPYSPACLLENLESEKSPRIIRQLAYEELVIRYDIDFPFETDMFVAQQKQAIAKYAEWIKTNKNRFQEGKWYFAGNLMI
ncbi:MAG: hypothetical protein GY795_31245 [Desulfobacterales bacterium]|nr:hypothetical protein [Desulfobacterales bacterium]